ncbi:MULTISPECIES: LURP-one-related/scramblase family protein [Eubacteriales]|uniref:Tubby C 2 family protein n=1 Tax=Clostridium isatidis TaxID=182773 RepID=A0A343JFE0_9CLOT|nr:MULTISPECIES: hypothetical protein [Eubacteriales]ASW44248.1 hypothetical protein BEN51_12525 [Clostridium isatidis]MBU5454507.1 hypothetical protein [Caproiciproducens sp. MSJ-32]NLZ35524.1 hypothetical protein [Clostridiales bacterium]
MRKFSINQRLFSIGSKFDVLNEHGKEEYIVEADKFDIGKNIYVYDLNNRRILFLKQQIRIGAHRYIAYDSNMMEIAEIRKEFMFPEYNITGQMGNIKMRARDVLGRHYIIEKENREIGRIDKEISIFTDSYSLEVFDEEYTVFLIGLLVIIDMVRYHENN